MDGKALKKLADESGLGPMDVCLEAGISIPTLYKIYNDKPVRQKMRIKVEQTIKALSARSRAALEYG